MMEMKAKASYGDEYLESQNSPGRLRQEVLEFESSLGYIMRSYLKK
jgi:hypothetical protein